MVIQKIAEGLAEFSTPQQISDILSAIVTLAEIEKNDCNLNISRYISTAVGEAEVDLQAIHTELPTLAQNIQDARDKHNTFLQELGLPALP